MAPALELRGITKRFGALVANDNVSLSVEAGEVFALVGENGAGKTTLMNVVYGLYRPDAGEIRVRGEVARIRGPADAIRLGIGMVHQHFMLVPPLTVAENVVLGREPRRLGLFDRARAEREVREVSERYGFALDPAARVEELSVAEQQRVEIVKALWRGAEILILDEPTAVLSPTQAEELYRVVGGLAAAGKTVVFISHKLREVLAAARRVGVMRRGMLVAVEEAKGTDPDRLAELMVGGRTGAAGAAAAAGDAVLGALAVAAGAPVAPVSSIRDGARPVGGSIHAPSDTEHDRPPGGRSTAASPGFSGALLDVHALTAQGDRGKRALDGVSFSIGPGEILAVAGVDGNGQAELAEVLTGLRPATGGTVRLLGADVTRATVRERRDQGVGHVPEDRHRRGLCLDLDVAENFALGRHDGPPFARGRWVDFAGRAAAALRLIAAFDVRPPDPATRARALSGGNQQKVILARELDAAPRLLVAMQPTRGLDVNAVALIHDRLRAHRAAGHAVLLVSLDLDEVLALADRILVLYGGRVMGTVLRQDATEALLGRLMLGGAAPAAPEAAHA